MFDKKDAIKLWEAEMGNTEYAYDFSGKKIKKADYMENNEVGWVVTYLKPIELGGPTHIGNTIIMHQRTLEEKGLNYPNFIIVGQEYTVKYDEKGDFYYVEKVLSDDEDDDSYFI
ncbi:MAG TPA: hypothetical protein PLH44_04200 [Bacilli bacterium]|jgi:hypothetical protein|nr:hypothetical protein [Bacilli bacterium]NLT01332.1 hypothetical protein [Acholeplasmataceae bacterium]HNZ78278.1 hypothetical protein [Bacilli bacterium]HOD61912.1 hypothetical protein [Bacilli bacterium]HOE07054.1 hypothetical protein [Bacilli bacterium]